MKIKLFLNLILSIHLVLSEKFRFDNYTLYKIIPENISQIKLLQHVQNNDFRYDFWTDPKPPSEFVNILSSPGDKEDLESFFNDIGIKFEVAMSNIQEAIDKETVKTYTKGNPRSMEWNGYYTNDQINAWIDDLAAAYPAIVTPLVGGSSYEGRPIRGLRISNGDGKRIIFIEGGIHSREWISPATVCFIINELLTSGDEETRAAARDFDWYIFPVTNPDGYIWSHEQFRMWRKNRRPIGSNYGIDLNRNWNSNWLVAGASIDPASDTYAGLGPFSEPESRTLSNFIRSIGDRIDIYLSIHSYSQLLLLPFGNTSEPLANYHEAMNIGRRAMGALSVRYGTQFITGNIVETLFLGVLFGLVMMFLDEATGGSDEWVKEQLNVPLVYCYELRDRGQYGFLLPEDQIRPSGEETMDSVLEMIHQAKRFGVINSGRILKASFTVLTLISMVLFLY